jgi:PKD repeat protein
LDYTSIFPYLLSIKKTILHLIPAFAALVMIASSCAKEPTLGEIQATMNGYSVSFSAVAENADAYLWDFGDGLSSTEATPVHVYLMSGKYTVSLTLSSKGGETKATKEIEITPSVTEMLSGGPAAVNGKTWVLSAGYTEGLDGGSGIDNSLQVILPLVEDLLTAIGLGEEYDNEFTFYSDGRYKVDVKNGIALATALYGKFTNTNVTYGNDANNLGVSGASYTAPASATWTLHEEDLVLDAITNPMSTEVPAPHGMVTITNKAWISLSGDAYFGILDFPTTRKFIIKEITPDKINVCLFICAYESDPTAWSIPEYLFHLTYIPKK